jgi:hypothetical protein
MAIDEHDICLASQGAGCGQTTKSSAKDNDARFDGTL